MARLDHRLLPLIETLAAAGADWLVFELTDGIRTGRAVEESAETLERARTLVREGSFGMTPVFEDSMGVVAGQPIIGDEQIDWAIQYVDARLEDTVAMLIRALETLGKIVQGSSRVQDRAGTQATRSEVTLVLVDDEVSLSVNRVGAIEALNAMEALKSALRSWGATVRGG